MKEQGEQRFTEFCDLLKHECFDAGCCDEHVKPVQRGALEPWYQRTGPDGSKMAPWPRVLGIRRSAREGTWFSEAVESGFERSYPAGRRGFYTGDPGNVSADVWLLRAWCRARGGVARMGEALAARLLQLEGERDVLYMVEPSASLQEPPRYFADMKPAAIPDWPVWMHLLHRQPRAAPAVARAARAERSRVGLTWNLVRSQWDMDVQRLVAALESDGDRAARHAHVLTPLAEFRRREGRWPDAFANRRSPIRQQDINEARLAVDVGKAAQACARDLLKAWDARTFRDWLALAGIGEGGSSGSGSGPGGGGGGRVLGGGGHRWVDLVKSKKSNFILN